MGETGNSSPPACTSPWRAGAGGVTCSICSACPWGPGGAWGDLPRARPRGALSEQDPVQASARPRAGGAPRPLSGGPEAGSHVRCAGSPGQGVVSVTPPRAGRHVHAALGTRVWGAVSGGDWSGGLGDAARPHGVAPPRHSPGGSSGSARLAEETRAAGSGRCCRSRTSAQSSVEHTDPCPGHSTDRPRASRPTCRLLPLLVEQVG